MKSFEKIKKSLKSSRRHGTPPHRTGNKTAESKTEIVLGQVGKNAKMRKFV